MMFFVLLYLPAVLMASRAFLSYNPNLHFDTASTRPFFPSQLITAGDMIKIAMKSNKSAFFRRLETFNLTYADMLCQAIHFLASVRSVCLESHLALDTCLKIQVSPHLTYDNFIENYLPSQWVPSVYIPPTLPIPHSYMPYEAILTRVGLFKINVERPYLEILLDVILQADTSYEQHKRQKSELAMCVATLRARESRYNGIEEPALTDD